MTLRYGVTRVAFWAGYTGASGFAAAFLLESGMSSADIGILLAAAGLLSCLLQPVLAGIAMAAAGTVGILLTVDKKDACVRQSEGLAH